MGFLSTLILLYDRVYEFYGWVYTHFQGRKFIRLSDIEFIQKTIAWDLPKDFSRLIACEAFLR